VGCRDGGLGQERTAWEAKLASAHLCARHTPSEMAGALGRSFLFPESFLPFPRVVPCFSLKARLRCFSLADSLSDHDMCCRTRTGIAWDVASMAAAFVPALLRPTMRLAMLCSHVHSHGAVSHTWPNQQHEALPPWPSCRARPSSAHVPG
jgi:hypothetical protein